MSLSMKQQKQLADVIMARACQLILTEGQFDMKTFNGFDEAYNERAAQPVCGTACCIGGNLAIAAKEYRIPGSKKYFTANYANKVWELFNRPSFAEMIGTSDNFITDPTSKENLPDFYAHDMALHWVTPNMAVAHLVSGKPLYHFWDAKTGRPNRRTERYVTKARKMIKELL